MRLIRAISAEEENWRLESIGVRFLTPRRDPVEPEPIGTLLLFPYRIVGYDFDCDGSLMARLERVSLDGVDTLRPPDKDVFCLRNCGLYPSSGFVVDEDELVQMVSDLPSVEVPR